MYAAIAPQTPGRTMGLCGVCRYFSLDRCCHSSARLDGHADGAGECPYFRFEVPAPAAPWSLR